MEDASILHSEHMLQESKEQNSTGESEIGAGDSGQDGIVGTGKESLYEPHFERNLFV